MKLFFCLVLFCTVIFKLAYAIQMYRLSNETGRDKKELKVEFVPVMKKKLFADVVFYVALIATIVF